MITNPKWIVKFCSYLAAGISLEFLSKLVGGNSLLGPYSATLLFCNLLLSVLLVASYQHMGYAAAAGLALVLPVTASMLDVGPHFSYMPYLGGLANLVFISILHLFRCFSPKRFKTLSALIGAGLGSVFRCALLWYTAPWALSKVENLTAGQFDAICQMFQLTQIITFLPGALLGILLTPKVLAQYQGEKNSRISI